MTHSRPKFIGPHEGRELELMISGAKPLSMFIEPVDSEVELFPEERFDAVVSERKLVKTVSIEEARDPQGNSVQLRRVLYALPKEAWRIQAFLLVQNLYNSLSPSWRPDLERVIGLLLGYDRDDVELYLNWHNHNNMDDVQGQP